MSLFNRKYRIAIGVPGDGGVEITRLNVKFDITRSSDSSNNSAKFNIINMAPETRATLDYNYQTGSTDDNNPVIIFQTQYSKDTASTGAPRGFQTVFSGQVMSNSTKRDADGSLNTTIIAGDGYSPLREGRISQSFQKNTSKLTVVRALLEKLNMPVGEIVHEGALDEVYQSGYVVDGSIRDALDSILKGSFMEWSIQDDAFDAYRTDLASTLSVLELNNTTGLIGTPQATKARVDKVANAEVEKSQGITVQSLLAPTMLPNRLVNVTSIQYPRGRIFKVLKVRHTGDYRGNDWSSEATLIEFKD